MKPEYPAPVKLFMGVMHSDMQLLEKALEMAEAKWGESDYRSAQFTFDTSEYYADEMGGDIFKIIVSFRKLIDPGKLAEIKILTNEIEDAIAPSGARKVNLDPGYMDYNKVVLASAKYNSHKIYLDRGIYADLTLWYEKGTFKPNDRAFPDFRSGMYTDVFLYIRALYKKALLSDVAG